MAYQFKHCGQLVFAPGLNEDEMMELALELGAEDVIVNEDGSIEVIVPANDFIEIKAILAK